MHWFPDALLAIGQGSSHDTAEQSRQPHRTTPLRTAIRARTAATSGTRPDYGCVDWFVYEEHRRSEQESV